MPGQIWKEEIPRAIRQAGVFLACLSSRSVEKVGYVHNEFRLALSQFGERPPGWIYLIPVRLNECVVPDLQIPDRGLSLRDIQWVDLWEDGSFDRLIKAIEYALESARAQELTSRSAPAEQLASRDAALRSILSSGTQAGSTLRPGTVFRDIDAPWCPEMVVIPPGEFIMGSTEPERRWATGQGAQREWLDWEKPQHRVVISEPFAVGKHPITRGQFATFVEATAHDMGAGCWVFTGDKWEHNLAADWCAPGFEQTDDHPVVGVSWQDATAYVEWLGRETGQPYRLLSEGEWEYACRAGTTTRYSWGDDPPTPEQANFGMEVRATTAVGTYPPNSFGLYDMHGNVLEWCQDCWNQGYAGGPRDGSAWMTGTCGRRVLRGGSWYDIPALLRSANRSGFDSGTRNANAGFRVARTLSRSEGRMRALNFLGSGAEPG